MLKILLIGAGGFVGTVLRYLVSGLAHSFISAGSAFPYGTLVVNTLGCFLIGFFSGLVETRQLFDPETRVFVLIGLLGGFTTFSSFGYETFALMRDGQTTAALSNIGLQVVLGLAAVWCGHVLARLS